jgi:hypothetical protein
MEMVAAPISAQPNRVERVSAFGVATIVAAIHVAILASRVHGRHHHRPISGLSWEAPRLSQTTAATAEEPPSNPRQSFSAGELALTIGMAVVALTLWLHVMRISGARTY